MTRRYLRQRLTIVGLGLGLAFGVFALAPAHAAGGSRSALIYHKSRSFRIPVNILPADRNRIQELQLWVSEDRGETWKAGGRTRPDRPSFTFRAARDAEFWFAVRMLDTSGRLTPGEDEEVQPSLKVVVDTTAPTVQVDPDGRRGSEVGVRWEVHDEHLDLKTLAIEYQAQGVREWRQAPIRRAALIGRETWEAGTAEPLRVRVSVEDRAGNVGEAIVAIPEGTPANPADSDRNMPNFGAPAVSPIAAGSGFAPVDEPPPTRFANNRGAPPPDGMRSGAPSPPSNDPFAGPGGGGAPLSPSNEGRTAAPSPSRTILVPSPQFNLQYAVDEAGPSGPAVVELYFTRDGGQTWSHLGDDTDRVSPFPVNLGGEGTYGLALVARAASGLGDQPPAFGDPPQLWVEVDSTPPAVHLDQTIVGTGTNLGKVAIAWRASDLHLANRPVTLQWRSDQDGGQWQTIAESLNATGSYVWTVPPNTPPKFHIRVEAVDTMGNRGSEDTTARGPIIVDRTRPRSRIIDIDRASLNANGPQARPLR